MRHAAAVAVVFAFLVMPAAAQSDSVLTGSEARVAIKRYDSRNVVKWCKRLGPAHIRCGVRAVIASVEEEETGTDVQDISVVLVADVWPHSLRWGFPGYPAG